MPYLVTIKETTQKDNREVGDVMWVYPDDKVFSEKESVEFTIEKISEEKAQEFLSALPKLKTAFKAASTSWSLDEPETTEVVETSSGWCEVKDKSVYRPVKYVDGAFINKIVGKEANKTVLISKDTVKS